MLINLSFICYIWTKNGNISNEKGESFLKMKNNL